MVRARASNRREREEKVDGWSRVCSETNASSSNIPRPEKTNVRYLNAILIYPPCTCVPRVLSVQYRRRRRRRHTWIHDSSTLSSSRQPPKISQPGMNKRSLASRRLDITDVGRRRGGVPLLLSTVQHPFSSFFLGRLIYLHPHREIRRF